MVGYNKEELINFISILDGYKVEDIATRPKIIASFYKLMISDIDKLSMYRKDIFSLLVMLYAVYKKGSVSGSKNTYSTIASDTIVHELNRALYSQTSVRSLLGKSSDVPAIQLLSMKEISDSSLSGVIALFMIYFNADFSDLITNEKTVLFMLENNLFTGNSFASIEEVINAVEIS